MTLITPDGLRLRKAAAEDVPPLVALARASWLSAFEGVAPAALVDWWRANDREPGWYRRYWPSMTVADVSGELAGVVQPAGDEVNGLWVDPAWQRRGIGRALLRAAEAEIRSAGYGRAWLSCSGYNVRAMRFYESCGYRPVSTHVETVPDGLTDEMIVFERLL